MIPAHGFAAQSAQSKLAPFAFERREPGVKDIVIEISHCGVCHSDIHQARNEWGGSIFPMVPGHEIIGKVLTVGKQVKRFKVGDTAGVGCFVDSCRECSSCQEGLESYCERGMVGTYNGRERGSQAPTYGGYSNVIVVDEDYSFTIAPQLDPARVAPLLCAGITTYSPLKHWRVGQGQKVGIVGLGGLGHMGVKFARAFGAEVTVFTTSEAKIPDAKALGAHKVVLTRDPKALIPLTRQYDFILNTVSAPHDLNQYINLLKRDKTMCLVGIPDQDPSIKGFGLVGGRRSVAGSLIGGLPETQEMLDYCAEHNILADIELIAPSAINEAYGRMINGQVKYRFVLDLSLL